MKESSESGRDARRAARRNRVTGPKRVSSSIQSQGQPAYREFLDRAKGTLPEIIGDSDLDTLNSALGFLFAHLREARRQFEQEGDAGRFAAFTALAAYWMFVVVFKTPLAESLEVPILRLQAALAALDNNLVEPIVKPARRRGRAPSSPTYATLRGHAAGSVKQLVGAGLSRREAHEAVAKQLSYLGVHPERGSGDVTAATVRNWCDEVASDVGRHGPAAQFFDSMFAPEEQRRLSELPKERAKSFVLKSLVGWVQSVFPELRKST